MESILITGGTGSFGKNLSKFCCACILTCDAVLYDLYIWPGPIKPETFDEFYDILDGLVTPVEILEDLSTGPSRSELPFKFEIHEV